MSKQTLKVSLTGDQSDLKKAFKESEKDADSFGKKLEDIGGKVSSNLGGKIVGGLAGLGIGATAGAIVGKGFSDALASETNTANLGTKLGLTPEMTQAAGKVAGDIYSQAFGDSLEDVSEAVALTTRDLGGLGNVSKDEFEDITKSALTLKDVFGVELGGEGGVITSVSQLMRNKMAPDAKHALDVITVGLRSPANKAGDLLETFNEYSPLFSSLGLDAQTSLGLMNQAVAGGARNSDIAADALKEFSIRARAATDPNTIAGFSALGLSAWDMSHKIAEGGPAAQAALQLTLDKIRAIKDPTEQARIATLLFGTQSEDMQKSLLAFNPATAVASLGQVEGATDRAKDAANTHATKLEEWKRKFETNVSGFINETGIPALESLQVKWSENIGTSEDFAHGLDVVKEKGEGASKWWSDNIGSANDFGNGLRTIGDAAVWVGDKLGWVKDHVLDPFIGTVQSIIDKYDSVKENPLIKLAMGVTGAGSAVSVLSNVGRANGGTATAGHPIIVGERRPEEFVPNQDGRIKPRVSGGSDAGGPTVVVQVSGSVISERDLVEVVRNGLLRAQSTSARPILPGVSG